MPKSNESTRKSSDISKTSLLAEIHAEQPRYRRGTKIDRIINQLEGQDRDDFIAALRDRSIPNVVIMRVMARRGFDISESGISTYRTRINGSK